MINDDQAWTLAIGILFMISEVLGIVKKGPNGLLHAVWKFYNLKVIVEVDEEEIVENRVDQTGLSDRETIVLDKHDDAQMSPNVLLIK